MSIFLSFYLSICLCRHTIAIFVSPLLYEDFYLIEERKRKIDFSEQGYKELRYPQDLTSAPCPMHV